MVKKEIVQNDDSDTTLEVLTHPDKRLVELVITKDGLPFSIFLDNDDRKALIDELAYAQYAMLPKFKGIDEEAVKEAMYYSQQKRLLEESMKEYIATIKPTQHIQKELQTIELDPLNREIEVTKTKLKENVKRK